MRFSKAPLIATLMAALVALLIILPVMAGEGQDGDIDRGRNELKAGVYPADIDGTAVANISATYDDGLVLPLTSTDTEFDGDVYVSNQHNTGASNWVVVGVHDFDETSTSPPGTADPLVVFAPEDDIKNTKVTVDNESGDEREFDLDENGRTWTIRFAVVHPDTPRPNYYNVDGDPAAVRLRTNPAALDGNGDPVPATYQYLDYNAVSPPADLASFFKDDGVAYTAADTLSEGALDLPEGVDAVADFRSQDHIEASDGDVLVISHAANEVELVVDGVGPSFSGLTPDDHIQRRSRVSLDLTVADEGSGLRDDSEDGGDNDGDTKEEPLTSESYGALADIGVFWGVDNADDVASTPDVDESLVVDAEDLTNDGSTDIDLEVDWIEITEGAAYEGAALFGEPGGADTYGWVLWAKDRVGNTTTTDADADEDGTQSFMLTIDDESPVFHEIRTGIGYSSSKDREVPNRKAIAVSFKNEDSGKADKLDTVEDDGFTVSGHTVVDVVHPNKSKKGSRPDTRNVVYLYLEDELGGNELPRVQVSSSAVVDLAGNSNQGADSSAAKDRISPRLTVTVTGDAANADGRPLSTGEFDVTIDSDEPLNGVPIVTLVTIAQTDGTSDDREENEAGASRTTEDPREARDPKNLAWRIATMRTVRVSTEGSTSWSVTFDDGNVDGVDGLGLAAVIVTGVDRAAGSPKNDAKTDGWEGDGSTPAVGDELTVKDIDDAGLLVEFDDELVEAMATVTPDAGDSPADRQTESMSPFIKLDFEDEGAEYTVVSWAFEDDKVDYTYDDDGTDVKGSFYAFGDDDALDTITQGDDEDKTNVDSYDGVTITAITVDGVDVSAGLQRVDDAEFSVSLQNLALGKHTITYTAEDAAGNEVEDVDVEFEILPRSDYKVGLRPGWNLVSVPADPADPAIGSVLEADHPAQTVLSYQNSEWVTAARDAETGDWVGTLTDISAGYGYFIQSGAFDDLATLIPEANPTTQLPVVSVNSGWNLLGVVDVGQEKAGTTRDADEYFASIEWSVGYGFDTATNRWEKITKDASDNANTEDVDENDYVENGAGYWVWATEAGTLVP